MIWAENHYFLVWNEGDRICNFNVKRMQIWTTAGGRINCLQGEKGPLP